MTIKKMVKTIFEFTRDVRKNRRFTRKNTASSQLIRANQATNQAK